MIVPPSPNGEGQTAKPSGWGTWQPTLTLQGLT